MPSTNAVVSLLISKKSSLYMCYVIKLKYIFTSHHTCYSRTPDAECPRPEEQHARSCGESCARCVSPKLMTIYEYVCFAFTHALCLVPTLFTLFHVILPIYVLLYPNTSLPNNPLPTATAILPQPVPPAPKEELQGDPVRDPSWAGEESPHLFPKKLHLCQL
jgi:hypothetical protein